jgi:hypothetical protein
MFQHLESNQSLIRLIHFIAWSYCPLFSTTSFELCSNVCTCLMWCSFVLSKYIECMITLFRQRAARGSWVCCRRSLWATTWWGQVSSNLSCPTLLYNSLSHITLLKLKDCLVCIYLTLVYLFGLIMVNLCYFFNLVNEHDVMIYDTMMLSRWGCCDYIGGLRLFPEYLSIRTCLGSDIPG